MRIDMHVHTRYSEDSSAEIEEIIKTAMSKGLGGIAITDHNSIDGWEEALRYGKKYGILIIRGEEISSKEGHILAYGIHGKIEKGKSAEETVNEIRKQGGVAIAAHPFRISNGLGADVVKKVDFDGIEAINSRSPGYINRKGKKLAMELDKPMTGGSDAHTPQELGTAYTEFPDWVKSEGDAIKAIKEGEMSAGGSSQSWASLISQNLNKVLKWVGRKGKRI
jgi:predicted metal-dependent phosphoesterase TrpH